MAKRKPGPKAPRPPVRQPDHNRKPPRRPPRRGVPRSAALFVGVVLAAAAQAQLEPQVPFERLDTDRNGAISRIEASTENASGGATAPRAAEGRLFRRLDRNNDGYLSDAELDHRAAGQANWIALDRHGDGRIAPREFRSLAR
jgi:hypothetical protein